MTMHTSVVKKCGDCGRAGLGDRVARIATPIARALNLPCVDPATDDLRPESSCAKRKAWLNRLSGS
jgi:hypothetical protein